MHNHTAKASLPKSRRAAALYTPPNFDALADSALLDVKAIAALLGCSVNSVWRKAKASELPRPLKIGPRSTRWPVGAIRAYLAGLAAAAQERQ